MTQHFASVRVQVLPLFLLRRSLCELRRFSSFAAALVAQGVEGVDGYQKRFTYALSLFLRLKKAPANITLN
jgi:hypothetical protein